MPLEEKGVFMNFLICCPIMVHPGMIDASGASHSNLFPPHKNHKINARITPQMCSGTGSAQGLGVTFNPSGALHRDAWYGGILEEWCVEGHSPLVLRRQSIPEAAFGATAEKMLNLKEN